MIMSYLNVFLVAACALLSWLRRQLLLSLPRSLPRVTVLFVSLLLAMSSVLTSCDNSDEPALKVDYFFAISSNPPEYAPVPKSEMVYKVTKVMMDSIRKVYPKINTEGNDAAVLLVCSNVYHRYLQEHPDAAKYFFCQAKLNRGDMRGTIVVSYRTISCFNF